MAFSHSPSMTSCRMDFTAMKYRCQNSCSFIFCGTYWNQRSLKPSSNCRKIGERCSEIPQQKPAHVFSNLKYSNCIQIKWTFSTHNFYYIKFMHPIYIRYKQYENTCTTIVILIFLSGHCSPKPQFFNYMSASSGWNDAEPRGSNHTF
jgi:hypothetical protein